MRTPLTLRLVAAVLLSFSLLAAGGVGTAGSVAASRDSTASDFTGSDVSITAERSKRSGVTTRRVQVKWAGWHKRIRTTRRVGVPGVGTMRVTCRRNNVSLKLITRDRTAETQLWTSKFEVKNRRNVVAVRNARVYSHDTAAADGTEPTARHTTEGLNQRKRVENYSNGFLYGLISQRRGRHQSVNDQPLRPVTSFSLNWYWNALRQPKRFRYCEINVKFTKTTQRVMGVNWHGEADAKNVQQTTKLANLGRLRLRCSPGKGAYGRTVTFYPKSRRSQIYAEVISGEGPRKTQIRTISRNFDERTGIFGPYRLPPNSMMRLILRNGQHERTYLLSSYHITDSPNAALNLCEVAASEM